MLKPALQLKLGQQLTMTPQLQQAIRLLQLPVLELQAQIREALESNVMLESEDESASLETAELEAPQFEAPTPSAQPAETPTSSETEPAERDSDLDEQDWSDAQITGPSETPWSGDDVSQDFSAARGETLQEHLTWQLEMSRLSERDMRIGAAIIDAINDDGYVIESLDEIARNLQPEIVAAAAEVERVLGHVQAMDPAGVGARSVSECIELQLRQLDSQTPGRDTALIIAANYLDQVADQQYALLRRQLRVTEEEMEHALVLVRACQPRPGSSVHSVPAEYIVPDVFVRRTERGWAVDINPASLPRIRVNQSYAGLIGRSADHAMLRTQLQEARWLIRSLEIRNETLLKVARCIVQRQSAFLEHGDESMQPMILKDVAEAVQMHESTISRVTTNKYMHTHRGVFEFRYFFSSHVAASDGSEMSSTAIRAKIRKLVSAEEPDKPLSDSRIAEILSREGVLVARRTVAKYREALGIPPSSERKKVPVR
jgi:RNA polymerase sigma-54 factor